MATGVAPWSQTAASNSNSDSAVNWAEGQAPSTVNDSARGMMASVAKWRDDISGSLATGGTSTAYTLTSNQSFASLSALNGQMILMQMSVTNGASPTLAVDSLTPKALTIDGSTAIPTGALVSGSVWGVTYSTSAGAFLVHAPPTVNPSFTTVTASGAVTGGSLVTGGTLSVTGNVAVNTNKFNITAASGNTAIAGTLDVTGGISAASVSGLVATQSNQETGTSTTTLVTPGRQHFHQSAAKGWTYAGILGNSVVDYNVSTISDNGTGDMTVNWATDFSTANYCVGCSSIDTSAISNVRVIEALAAGTTRVTNTNASNSAADPSGYFVQAFGDQA